MSISGLRLPGVHCVLCADSFMRFLHLRVVVYTMQAREVAGVLAALWPSLLRKRAPYHQSKPAGGLALASRHAHCRLGFDFAGLYRDAAASSAGSDGITSAGMYGSRQPLVRTLTYPYVLRL